jgi:uncharacterized repeat protein (TIGR01451 family)
MFHLNRKMRNRTPLQNRLAQTLWISSLTAGLICGAPLAAWAADVTFNFKMQSSGTASFDADDTAGNDSSETNQIVRTQDIITYKWEYAINNGAATNVVLHATVPANVEITMPAVCAAATSQIVINPATGAQTIDCAIGTLVSGSSGSIDLKARVLGQERAPSNKFVANADKTSATGSFTGSQINNALNPVTTALLTISAKPKADLIKDSAYVESSAVGEDGVTPGLIVRYPITVAITGGGKGSEALVGPINFTDQLLFNGGAKDGLMIPGAKLYTWRSGYGGASITPGSTSGCNRMGGDAWSYYGGYPNGKVNSSYYAAYGTPEWSTQDAGTWTCTQAGPGQPIQVNITGADTTGNHAPKRDYYGGSVLDVTKTYLVVGTVHLWVPVSAITAAGGQLNVRNKLSGFAMKGASGADNIEPTLANNQYDHTLVSTNGSFTSHYATDVDNRGTPLPGMSAIYGGDGPVMPGQTFTDRVYIYNSGALAWAPGAILCTAVDNKTQQVIPLADDPNSAVRNFSSAGLGTDYVIEYGTGDFPTVLDHKKATCRNSDSPGGWTSNLNSVPGGLDAITRIRVRAVNAFPAANVWDIAVNLKARNYYVGTTNQIPLGTKLVQHSSFLIPDFPGPGQGEPGIPTDWYAGYYQRDNNYYVGWGDRLTLTRAIARVDKQNVPNQPVVNAVAGTEVSFILKPSLTTPIPASVASNIIVKDSLPIDLDYVIGSANIPPTTVANNPDGSQTVTWDLGPRLPGQPIPDITYKARIRPDAANNSTSTNTVVIESPDDGSLESARTDKVDINVGNTAAFRIFKEVDRELINQNEQINYSLFYANTGSSNVGDSKFIDVLPYNGDNRIPKTNYQGTLTFNTITGTNGETYEYTNRPHSQINPDPDDASNSNGTTQWCSGFGAPGCPTAPSDVTGIRISAPAFPKNTPTRKLTLTMSTNGNTEDNYYSNNFLGRAKDLLGLLQSNDVFSKVRVPSRLLLVKRITSINGVAINSIVDDASTTSDNHPAWPNGYLTGAINGGAVKPGDDVEYTIYYLSSGDTPVLDSKFCDLVPTNTTYLPSAYAGSSPIAFGGNGSGNLGIQFAKGSQPQFLTSDLDGDIGNFFASGITNLGSGVTCTGANTNGAVVVDMGNIPHAGFGGQPAMAYGAVRFKAKVR